MQNRHRPRLGPLREAGRVLQGVDGGPPDGNPGGLDVTVELFPSVTILTVEKADYLPVQPSGHRGTGVDTTETELRVRAHLRGLSPLGHQPLPYADHDRMVLGKLPGEVPEALAHGVGGNRVGLFLGLVETGLIESLTGPISTEETSPQCRHRSGESEKPLHPSVHEGDVGGELLDLFAADPSHIYVLKP